MHEEFEREMLPSDMGAICKDIWWGQPPVGTQMTFVGTQNVLSPWLQDESRLLGWRKRQ